MALEITSTSTAIVGSVLLNMVGKNFLTQAISDTTNLIFSLVKGAAHYTDFPEITNCYEDMDIHANLEVVNALMEEIKNYEESDKSIKVCLKNLHEIVEKIFCEMKEINDIVAYHKTKYFNNLRSVDLTINLNKVKKYKKIMDKRLELLLNILSVKKNEFVVKFS